MAVDCGDINFRILRKDVEAEIAKRTSRDGTIVLIFRGFAHKVPLTTLFQGVGRFKGLENSVHWKAKDEHSHTGYPEWLKTFRQR